MKFQPVSGVLGAEVHGPDLRALSDADVADLRSGVHEFEVVFVRGAHLTAEEQLGLGGRFGEVNVFPLAKLHGATEPTPMVIADSPDKPVETDFWHTDVTWTAEPPDYAFLQALVVPERGGDTLWASMTAAHDALSPAMQEFVAGLHVVHDNESFISGIQRHGTAPGTAELAAVLRAQYPPVVHPLVRVHPDTGRRALFLGGTFMRRIDELTDAESDALLRFLRRHIDDPRFHCRWRWQPGDIAIWDERSTNHRSAGDHFPQPRSVRRIEVGGARPDGVRAPAALGLHHPVPT